MSSLFDSINLIYLDQIVLLGIGTAYEGYVKVSFIVRSVKYYLSNALTQSRILYRIYGRVLIKFFLP